MANGADGSIVIDTTLDNDGFNKGAEKLLSAIQGLTQRVNDLGGKMQQAFSGLAAVLQSVMSAAQQSATATNTGAQQATQAADQATAAQQRSASASAQAASASSQAARATASYDKELAKLEKQIDTAKGKLADYYQEIERIKNETDKTLEQTTTDDQAARVLEIEQIEIDKVNQKYADKIAALERLEAEYAKVAAARDAANQPQAEPAEAPKSDAAQGAQGLGDVADSGQDAAQSSDKLSESLEDVDEELKEKPQDAGQASEAVQAFRQALVSMASSAIQGAKNLARMGLKAVGDGFKRLGQYAGQAISKLRSFASQSKKTTLASNVLVKSLTSLKRLLLTRIKRMFISAIFNNVREGLHSLAKFNSEFNTKMSELKNTATRLSGNISAALGNLISTVAPVITKLINLLADAVAKLNQFFALLQGKRTYIAAKQGTEDYAESTEKAAKSQKKLNNELYGYDELTRQSDKDSNDSSSDDSTIEYEEIPINLPEKVKDWIERLKKAFQSGDWYKLGDVLSEGFNHLLDVIDDWINNVLRPKGKQWAERIADLLNGLVDGVNWEKLGKTVADGFNAIFDIVNTFFKKFNAKNFGRGIGTAVKSWFDNIDWPLIGETFANKWNLLLHTIEGFVTTPGIWTSIGSSIGKFIKSWFTTIDINSLAESAIAIINGVIDAIRAFLDQKPFEGVAQKISSAINRVLHEIDWAELSRTLSNLFIELLSLFYDTVQQIDWQAVGQAIGDFLGNIDWAGILGKVAGIVWTVFINVLSGLMSTHGGRMYLALVAAIKGLRLAFTVTEALWGIAVKRWIMTGISPLQTMPQLISEIGPVLKNALAGLAKVVGIGALAVFDAMMIAYDTKALVEAGKTYNEAQQTHNKETETALNSYTKLYVEKSKEVADQWAAMVYQIDTTNMSFAEAQEALAAKIETYWDGVPQNMWQGFAQGWDYYFGKNGAGLFALLSDAFTGAVNGIKNLLGIHSPSTVFAEIGMNLVQGLFSGISSTWNKITSFFSSALPRLKESLSSAWTSIKSAASTAWNKLKNTVTSAFSDTKKTVETAATQVKENLARTWDNIKSKAKTAWDNVKSTVTTTFSRAKETLSKTASEIQSSLSTAWSRVKSNASQSWDSVKSTVSEKFSDAKKAVQNAAQNLQTNLNTIWTGIKNNAQTAWSNLKTVTTNAFNTLKSNVTTAWANLKTSLGNVKWNVIGHNLVAGLNNGVAGAWGDFMGNVSTLVNNLISRIKSLFGVHSPSTVFAEIGEYLDAGLEQGMLDGERGLMSTAKKIAESVTDGMTPDAPKVQMTADGVIGSMQTIISGLNHVAETFKTIADVIADIGFTLPQIAEGTVVPYKTRLTSSDPSDGDSEALTGLLASILFELQALAQSVRNGESRQDGDIRIVINGHEIFQAVVDENNRAIRRTGVSPLRT